VEFKYLERDYTCILVLLYGGYNIWNLIIDDYTDYNWSITLRRKSDLKKKMFTLLTDLKIAGIDVKFIRCDDSGENKSFSDSCQAKLTQHQA
jgi:hypothetical protein